MLISERDIPRQHADYESAAENVTLPEWYWDVLERCDGRRTVADIAAVVGLQMKSTLDALEMLRSDGLVTVEVEMIARAEYLRRRASGGGAFAVASAASILPSPPLHIAPRAPVGPVTRIAESDAMTVSMGYDEDDADEAEISLSFDEDDQFIHQASPVAIDAPVVQAAPPVPDIVITVDTSPHEEPKSAAAMDVRLAKLRARAKAAVGTAKPADVPPAANAVGTSTPKLAPPAATEPGPPVEFSLDEVEQPVSPDRVQFALE